MAGGVVARVLDIRSVPTNILMMTVVASYGGLIITGLIGWPLWALVLAAVLPWTLLYALELKWTYRHFKWLALFYLLVLTQGGHFMEHLAQMVQIHFLGLSGHEASGIFSRLDVEWVHFGFNTWIIVAVILLLIHYRSNPWLWVTLAIAGWHQIEHTYLITQYVSTGVAGHPGLLAEGGIVGGGLPVTRPDLHFFYNVVETAPLLAAFGWTLRRSYNEWLAKAFPGAPDSVLVDATPTTEIRRFAPGQTIVAQGDAADAFYILTKGEVEVRRRPKPEADPVVVATLGVGEHFGEVGLLADMPRTATVVATDDVEVLRLDRETFERLVDHSQEGRATLVQKATERRPPHVSPSAG